MGNADIEVVKYTEKDGQSTTTTLAFIIKVIMTDR
jgi:hypothetical protein